MARSDLLVSLVRAGATGDKVALRSTVEALAADERAKRHILLADRLTKALNGTASRAPVFTPTVQSSGREYIAERTPVRRLDELILPAATRKAVIHLIEEQHRADLLRSHGLHPRHRVLLSGPPGNGKTTLGEALAEALAVPLFLVRYDMLIGSFLGETNQRLRRLFEYVRTVPCVLLFDEFDAIAKERGDEHETGEIKRVVSSLLLQVDTLPSYVVAVAATNHDELLDRAVWRRFELRLELPRPTSQVLLNFINSKLGLAGSLISRRRGGLLKALDRASFADAEIFCQDVQRWCVLSLGERSVEAVIDERLQEWKSRLRARADAERPYETPAKARRTRARGSSAQRSKKDSATTGSIRHLAR